MAGRTVLAETMAGAGEVSAAAEELHALEHAMADHSRQGEMEKLLARFGHAQARFDEQIYRPRSAFVEIYRLFEYSRPLTLRLSPILRLTSLQT